MTDSKDAENIGKKIKEKITAKIRVNFIRIRTLTFDELHLLINEP